MDHEEVDHLCQEASMPIEAVMAENGVQVGEKEEESSGSSENETAASSDSAANSTEKPNALTKFKTRNGGSSKPISPFLRAKSNSDKVAKTEVRYLSVFTVREC